MAYELISSKLIAPYFGTSLYVWTAVFIYTLGGLAVGYYLGGKLSLKDASKRLKNVNVRINESK